MSQSITDWLKALELERYAALFLENEIDLPTLQVLTEKDLTELGLPFGPRKRVLNAVAALKRGEEGGERRQLTVLFCDMVGFSELACRVDPEVLQGIVRQYEDTCAGCIARWEGYVFQRLGDGIVAFFGYPLAHESDAERSIHAGLEIIESLRTLDVQGQGRLQVRIGIATGMVVVSSAEKGAVGETMNLASRLQGVAAPGTIVVSERVHQLAGAAFDYQDLGLQTLKGIARPSRAYCVTNVSESAFHFDSPSPGGTPAPIGRGAELDLLREKWRQAETGSGQVALLMGEPGIGKSRVLRAVRQDLESRGVESLRFRCSRYHVNTAFHAIIDHYESALHFEREESAASKLDKLEARVVGDLGVPAADLPLLASMLSIPFQERYGALSFSPKRQKEETVRALVDVIEAAARKRATVVLFEDLHWADPTTVETLRALVERIPSMPLLAAMTARPEFKCAWSGRAHVTEFPLTRLTREDTVTLIAGVTGNKPLPRDLVDEIIERTDGIPLFAEELTKTILESGDVIEQSDRYVYAASRAGISVPPTLRDALMARLDRLASAKEIAQIGATIGREFSYELLEAVSAAPPGALADRLTRLTESGLVYQTGVIPAALFTFKHALVQDTAYDSLLKSRRQQLHGQIARALDERSPAARVSKPELLAHHYSAAGLDQEAAPLWRSAGEVALRRFALREAAAHLRNGLAALGSAPAGPDRDDAELEVRSLLGPTVLAVRGWAAPEVNDVLEPASRLAASLNRPQKYLPILHTLWVHHLCLGSLSVSLAWAEKLLQAGAATGDDGLTIMGHRAACASYYWMGKLEEARRHGDILRAMYDPERHRYIASLTNNDPLTGEGLYRPQILWMLGYPEQAVRACIEKDEHARRLNHPFDLAFALTLGAQVFDYLQEAEELQRRADEAERVGREHRLPLMSEVMAEIGKGVAGLRAGRYAESASQLREAVARLSGTGHRIWIYYLRALSAEAAAYMGDIDGALAAVSESAAQIDAGEDRVHFAEVLRLEGWLLMRKGRAEEAELRLRRAIQVARDQQARSWELRATTTLARLLAQKGEIKKARESLLLVYNWFTEGYDTRDLKDARSVLDELEKGE